MCNRTSSVKAKVICHWFVDLSSVHELVPENSQKWSDLTIQGAKWSILTSWIHWWWKLASTNYLTIIPDTAKSTTKWPKMIGFWIWKHLWNNLIETLQMEGWGDSKKGPQKMTKYPKIIYRAFKWINFTQYIL